MAINVVFACYDSTTFAPKTGLTPTWATAYDAVGESVIASPPTISEVGGGLYKFTRPVEDLAGIIDAGATSKPRYFAALSDTVATFAAYDAVQTPLPGLAPAWLTLKDAETNNNLAQPAFTELAGGLYKFAIPGSPTHSVGVIDLGATAQPRYLFFDSAEGWITGDLPVLSLVSPSSSPVTKDSVFSFTIEHPDGIGAIAYAAVAVSLDSGHVYEVVHDSVAFRGKYLNANNLRVSTIDGFTFQIKRDGGWPVVPGSTVVQTPVFKRIALSTGGGLVSD